MPSKRVLLTIFIVALIALAFFILFVKPKGGVIVPSTPTATPMPSLQIGEVSINVEVVDTPEPMRIGLAKYSSLPENNGMLFIYSSPRPVVFWMKGMVFPIDIIWIADGKIVGFAENAVPEPGVADNELKKYIPNDPVDMVLEVNAGFVQKHELKVGDSVIF